MKNKIDNLMSNNKKSHTYGNEKLFKIEVDQFSFYSVSLYLAILF